MRSQIRRILRICSYYSIFLRATQIFMSFCIKNSLLGVGYVSGHYIFFTQFLRSCQNTCVWSLKNYFKRTNWKVRRSFDFLWSFDFRWIQMDNWDPNGHLRSTGQVPPEAGHSSKTLPFRVNLSFDTESHFSRQRGDQCGAGPKGRMKPAYGSNTHLTLISSQISCVVEVSRLGGNKVPNKIASLPAVGII